LLPKIPQQMKGSRADWWVVLRLVRRVDGEAQAEDRAGTAAGAGKEGCVGLGAGQLATVGTGVRGAMARPRPEPPLSVDRESSRLINRSKMRSR
jgi:hypothetical protein